MLFNTPIFVFVFLPIVWVGYLLAIRLPWARAGIAWLAAGSLFFYGYWNWRFVPLLLLSIAFNYVMGRLLDTGAQGEVGKVDKSRPVALGGRRQAIMVFAIVVDLLVLAYFKYANFFAGSAAALAGIPAPVFDIVLPLGISFYTFTQLAYVVDAYRSGHAERSIIAYVLFVTFFPHLVAGPVLHHAEMMPQFLRDQRRALSYPIFLEGLAFFACGLAKKVLIADCVAPTANRAFTLVESQQLGFVDSWFGALAYTVQIYFDFSGYSDMAIGLALMLGIRLPLNFASPYRCRSILDFWRCWHMTLSRFLRDYLYIPLGGSRHGPARRQFNLMLTMLLGGLWHGASWNFVVWGGLHGLYLQINHFWRQWVSASPTLSGIAQTWRLPLAAMAWGLTFLAVVVAWVFFRAESFTGAWHLLEGMFLGQATVAADLYESRTAFYVGAGLLIAVFARNSQEIIGWLAGRSADQIALDPHRMAALSESTTPAAPRTAAQALGGGVAAGVTLALIVLLTLISAAWGTNEFIYFNF